MLWERNYHFVTECWRCHPGSCEIFVRGSLVVLKNERILISLPMFNSKSIKHGTFDTGSQGTSILFFKAVNYIYIYLKKIPHSFTSRFHKFCGQEWLSLWWNRWSRMRGKRPRRLGWFNIYAWTVYYGKYFSFIYYWFMEIVIHSCTNLFLYNLFHLIFLYLLSLPTIHILRAENIDMDLYRKHIVFSSNFMC